MTKHMMMLALAALAFAAPARAEDRSTGVRHDASLADLTASYNVQQSEVQNLRDKGWSWNDIGSALAISKRSGQPLQELVAQKDSGMSWSQISDRNGFKLTEINREAKQVAKDFKRADKQARRGDAVRQTGDSRDNRDMPPPSGSVSPDRDRLGPGDPNTQQQQPATP